ncbi:trigger factor [Roseobacter sp. YSTF-M11]|uniref:Trigger factor n=1 Tax=Roseobacter insulae TaxID=2859783 RepID=A0A9X1FW81_9RHOB|nr:DUF6314 family protein [Roseobacter insulae]MBW4708499.1 trigger factor [Roseobacter insulae]
MQTDPGARVLADFEGAWDLHRQIIHADGTTAMFQGVAVWTPEADGLIYRETGSLKMPQGAAMQSERQYRWAAGLDVYFDDGRFFHAVPARGGKATHWCDPDTYSVIYDFARWPVFTALWEVSGPRKSYSLHSHYSRR